MAVKLVIAVLVFFAILVTLMTAGCGFRVSPHGVVPIMSRFGFDLLWLGDGVSTFGFDLLWLGDGVSTFGFDLLWLGDGVSEVMHMISGYDFLRFSTLGLTNCNC